MTEPDLKQPANGFTRAMRRVMSVGCALTFFGLILVDVTGYREEALPAWLISPWTQAFLLGTALMMFDGVNELIKKFTGGK